MSVSGRYCLISPCRDEGDYLKQTLDSVIAQTVRPSFWVVVDDGSRDGTPGILSEYAGRHPWIHVIRREDRGGRSVGPGVIDAFYTGYKEAAGRPWEFMCKLDMDLKLPSRYFEGLLEKMDSEARLGSISGQPYYRDEGSGRWVSEGISFEMSVGASKFYRRRCFQEIGGFVRAVMWDGIDCHRCRMLGWKARSYDEEDLRFEHLRPMGSSDRGIVRGRMRHGAGQYFMGTGILYMTAASCYRMLKAPLVLGGASMWWGYVRSLFRREPRYGDTQFRKFLRTYQRACLLMGKRRATSWVERKRASAFRRQRETVSGVRGTASHDCDRGWCGTDEE